MQVNIQLWKKNSKNIWAIRDNSTFEYCELMNSNGFNFIRILKDETLKGISQPISSCPLHGFVGLQNATYRSDLLKNIPLKPFPGDFKIIMNFFTDLNELHFYSKTYFHINV